MVLAILRVVVAQVIVLPPITTLSLSATTLSPPDRDVRVMRVGQSQSHRH